MCFSFQKETTKIKKCVIMEIRIGDIMVRIYRDYYKMYSISPMATDIEIEGILKPLLEKYQLRMNENGEGLKEYTQVCEDYQTLTKNRRLYDLEYQRRNSTFSKQQVFQRMQVNREDKNPTRKEMKNQEKLFGEIVALEEHIHTLHEQVGMYSSEWMSLMDLKRELPKKVAKFREKIQKEKSYHDAILFLEAIKEREQSPFQKLFIDPSDFEKKKVCLELISMYTLKMEEYEEQLKEEIQKKEKALQEKEKYTKGQTDPICIERFKADIFEVSKEEERKKVAI